jgi:uncharacterized protein
MSNVQALPTAPAGTASTQVRVWWREPMMWLVLGGPLAVIVAGFATLAIAIANPDPVLDTRAASTASQDADSVHAGNLPAVQARNHAATGGKPEGAK